MTDPWLRRALDDKRDGRPLAADVWRRVVDELVAGSLDEAPVAALLMAATIRGLTDDEVRALTDAMVRSGEVLAFDRPAVDKHSSGGVGDSVSLIVVPLVAACGVAVAKLSGHALGHTGGTLDKLESIPGVRTDLEPAAFRAQVERIGCAIAAQSARLVPGDQRLYALRDRTGTVASRGLIAASIASKKIAGGASAIVFDVKVGSGAFMATLDDARALAVDLVRLVAAFERRSIALVTDMDEPLGPAIGDALEALEARDFLSGARRDPRLAEAIAVIAGAMLEVGGVAPDDAHRRLERALADGSAYRRFVALVEAQGGSEAQLTAMAPPAGRVVVRAERAGWLGAIDTVALGTVAREAMGRAGAWAGMVVRARLGDRLEAGAPLAELVALDGGEARRVAAAFRIADEPVARRPLVAAVVRDAEQLALSKGRPR